MPSELGHVTAVVVAAATEDVVLVVVVVVVDVVVDEVAAAIGVQADEFAAMLSATVVRLK